MDEDLECTGVWWLPERPDDKVAGVLQASLDTGITLQLIGAFEGFQGLFGQTKRYPIVLGLSKECKLVTLLNCIVSSSSFGAPGYISQTLTAWDGVLLGAHFENEAELVFQRANFQINRLSDWAMISGFSFTMTGRGSDERMEPPNRLELTYQQPADLHAVLPFGTVDLTFQWTTSGIGSMEPRIGELATITLEPTEPLTITGLDGIIRPIQNLMTLALDRAVGISAMRLFSPHVTMEVGESHDTRMTPIRFLRKSPQYKDPRPERRTLPQDMLFSLPDYERGWQELLVRWFELSSSLEKAIDLYLGTRYAPPAYLETHFLSLAQAAEVYHRRKLPNSRDPVDAHEARVRAIAETCPPEHKDWLLRLLNHSNEPRFFKRIADLAGMVQESLVTLLPNRSARDSFANRVSQSRNYYTHLGQEPSSAVAQDEDLYWLSEKISYLMRACLLQDLGFDSPECKVLVERNQRYLRLLDATRQDDRREGE